MDHCSLIGIARASQENARGGLHDPITRAETIGTSNDTLQPPSWVRQATSKPADYSLGPGFWPPKTGFCMVGGWGTR